MNNTLPLRGQLTFLYLNSFLVFLLLVNLIVGDVHLVRNLFALLALLAVPFVIRNAKIEASDGFWLVSLLVFGVYHLLHILLLGDGSEHGSGYIKFVLFAVFYVYLQQTGYIRESIYLGVVCGSLLTLLSGALEVWHSRGDERIGVGHNPIVFSNLLLIYGLVLVDFLFRSYARPYKLGVGLILLGLLILLSFTGTRGAYVTLIALAVFFASMKLRTPASKRSLVIALALVPIVLVGSYITHDGLKDRVQDTRSEIATLMEGDFDTSLGLRLNAWWISAGLIKEQPLFGIGESLDRLNAESERWVAEHQLSFNAITELSHVHNQYLQETLEYGVLGLLCLILLGIAFTFRVPESTRVLVYGLLIIFLVLSLTDTVFKTNVWVTAFFVVGSILRLESKAVSMRDVLR
ncbi:O-antigen ligase family protein [Nitrincola nitratireducens]|uniref:Lipid A core-O-antigen ligase n=1 Tax=Nitrincola nitratireducens TaxID=1229521 RepID=W9V0S7_9GAMM|nr:O-antigen ligase family protein [Nitrincola nitratireducens]EXJ09747.1 Lipid A core - O-antigen ligase [Nitrincola nitratireducens]